jgi:glucokinase
MSERLLVGLDIGGTKTAVVLATRPPVILKRRVFPTLPENAHVHLTRTGPRGHNKTVAVEGWASGAGMARLAGMETARALERIQATLLASAGSAVTARDVAEAAAAGGRVAQRIVKTAGERLGMAMAILIDVLNPQCIAVGGLALRMGDAILEPARAVVRREALAGSASLCRILPAALGEEIGDVAALCVAMGGGTQ